MTKTGPSVLDEDEPGYVAPTNIRCLCQTPWGTRCNAVAGGDGFYCEACLNGEPVGQDGRHWCAESSTPPTDNTGDECG